MRHVDHHLVEFALLVQVLLEIANGLGIHLRRDFHVGTHLLAVTYRRERVEQGQVRNKDNCNKIGDKRHHMPRKMQNIGNKRREHKAREQERKTEDFVFVKKFHLYDTQCA